MRRPRLTYANVTATLALTLALGGTSAYAAGLVTSGDIRNGTVQSLDIKNRTIKQKDVRPGGLGSAAIKDGSVRRADLADAVVSDVEWVEESSSSGSWVRHNQGAVCPAGKYVIGAAGTVGSPADKVALTSIDYFPSSPGRPTSVVASAHEHTPTDANWTLRVIAVCARIGPAS